MEPTDESIMSDYQAGNHAAMRAIFQRYKGRILHFCIRVLGNRAEAEEVAGDVFLAVVAGRNSYDPKRKFSTWIYTIVRNKCVTRVRRRKPLLRMWRPGRDTIEEEPWEPADPKELVSETLVREEMAVRVRKAIKLLPHEQREAIVLRQYHACSYEEISDILKCSLAKVKTLIFRGKERLRVDLAPLIKEGLR